MRSATEDDRDDRDLRTAFLAALNEIRSRVTVARVLPLVEAADYDGLIELLGLDEAPDRLEEIYRGAADRTGADVSAIPDYHVERVLDAVNEGTFAGTREIFAGGLAQHLSSAELAGIVAATATLTPRVSLGYLAYRTTLLRDPANAATADRFLDAYADRAVSLRAGVIAGNEGHRAAIEGTREGYRIVADARGAAVRRFWIVAEDERLCVVCRSIPDLNPAGVGLDEPFTSIAGTFDNPPDPHVNCRCEVTFELT